MTIQTTYQGSNKRQSILEDFRRNWHNPVNLGCGGAKYEDTLNCDMFGDPDIKLDVRSLPFKNDSLGMIEAHHLLEHLEHKEIESILLEWKRCITPLGMLVISVPDCEIMFALAISERFAHVPIKDRWRAINMYVYGNQEREGQYHKTGFSAGYLEQLLKDAGFKIIDIWRGFPKRPTPSFCILAKKEETKDERN